MRLPALLLATAIGAASLGGAAAPPRPQSSGGFAARIAAHSEPEGYFDTDNLISNERSYLEVVPELRRRTTAGGVYIGVGPDQNFSYIAATRPSIAFMVDLRRDNLLLHLLFKALFSLARTRVEYLALLLGRPVPADVAPRDIKDVALRNVENAAWRGLPVDRILAQVDRAPRDPGAIDALRRRVDDAVRKSRVALTTEDLATIDRFHRRFIEAGLELRFQSLGRPPQSHYPTYRQLLASIDAAGDTSSFVGSEERFQFVKRLQADDKIVPVVGNLAGRAALARIARTVADERLTVSTIYTSNVEYYLFRDGTFAAFAANLGRLPHNDSSVIVRSEFGRSSGGSRSSVHSVKALVDGVATGSLRDYRDLLSTR